MKASAANLPEGSGNVAEIEDLVYNFLMIILEHSLRQKDGWKVMVYFIVLDMYCAQLEIILSTFRHKRSNSYFQKKWHFVMQRTLIEGAIACQRPYCQESNQESKCCKH